MPPSVNTNMMPDRVKAFMAHAKLVRIGAASPLSLLTISSAFESEIRLRTGAGAHAVRRLDAKPCHVERGQEHQGEQRRNHEAADHRIGHRPPEHGGRDRDHAENGSGGGQEDRTQPMLA